MPLLGRAAIALWWDIQPAWLAEFGDWHSHEHFPERMSVPGFLRGSRWESTADSTGFFVLYELDRYETLTSTSYLGRLNAPTPWSTKMMPHHRNMVRSQCRVLASHGGGIGGALTTIRLSPQPGAAEHLQTTLSTCLADVVTQPGITAGHILMTDTPETASPTAEQRIRGADGVADWVLVITGYEAAAIEHTVATRFAPQALHRDGAAEGVTTGTFKLALTMTPLDIA
jgi:hypothetical protein